MTFQTTRARFALLTAILFVLLAGSRGAAPLKFESDAMRVDGWSLMGPMPLADDTETSAALGVVVEALGKEGPREDAVAWYGRDPYRWVDCPSDASGRVMIDHAFTRARQGQVVFLARRILCDGARDAALSVDADGRTAVWLNGTLVLDSREEPWTSPESDRWLRRVRMQNGANMLIVKNWRPEGDAWRVGVRLLTRNVFSGNGVAFPRWAFDTVPPWDVGKPPQVRWGAREILDFAGQAPTSITVTLSLGESKRQITATSGKWVSLAPLLPGESNRQPGLYVIDIDKAGPRAGHALALGPLDRAAADAAGIASLRKADLPPDVGNALRFLAQPASRHYDQRGAVFHTAMRSVAFFREWAKDPDKAAWPEGWLRALAPPPNPDSPPAPYMLFLPSEARLWSAPPPLVVVVPPEGADETCVLRKHANLASVARDHATLLAVVAPPRRGGKWPEAAAPEDFVAAVAEDVARRAGADPQRIAVLGIGSGNRIAALCDGNYSHLFAALAFLGPCERRGALVSKLVGAGPARIQNVLVLDANGVARVAGGKRETLPGEGKAFSQFLSFLKKHPLDPWVREVDVAGIAPPGARSRWLWLRTAADATRRAHVFAQFEQQHPNHISLSVENVSRLDLFLDEAPGVDVENPLVLDVTRTSPSVSHQRLQVIGPGFPEAVTVRLRRSEDATPHWELGALSDSAFEEPGADPVRYQLSKTLPALPDSDGGGIATLAARAIREASGADAVLLPVDAFYRGHPAGGVRSGDIAEWCDDMRIVMRAMAPKRLIETVARDYAGRRILITDGLDARAAPTDEGPETAYLDSALDTPEGSVRVAIAESLRTAVPELFEYDTPAQPPLFAHEILLRHFEKHPMIEDVSADIRLLPLKQATRHKKVIRRAP